MSTRLKHILLSSNNLKKTCDFFTKGLGFSLVVCTDTFAELTIGKKIPHDDEQQQQHHSRGSTKGRWYHQRKKKKTKKKRDGTGRARKNTISLNFEVVDVDRAVKQLLELGGTLDGPIQFTSDKSKTVEKIAAMTTIDGHSIGLFEPKERKNE